jgi:ABC-type long-subunit fatty acid transport system fused permease/ATPase subunit
LPDDIFLKPKQPNLGKFCRALELKMLLYYMVICNILKPFVLFYVWPLGNVVAIFSPFWHILSRKIWQDVAVIRDTLH